MTSQFEEVVVASHLTCSQKLFPDFRRFRFGLALRLFISSTPICIPFWLRQRTPIQAMSAALLQQVGLHNRDLPKNPQKIDHIEVCKFLVALTRTRKQCYLLWARRVAGVPKTPSVFLSWIDRSKKNSVYVDAKYFKEFEKHGHP